MLGAKKLLLKAKFHNFSPICWFWFWVQSPSAVLTALLFPRYVIEIGIPFLAFAPVRILRVFVYCSEVRRIKIMPRTIRAVFNWVSEKPNQSNYSSQSQRTHTIQWINQNSKQLHVAEKSAGKRVQVNHDWFWFYFWLDEKVARIF